MLDFDVFCGTMSHDIPYGPRVFRVRARLGSHPTSLAPWCLEKSLGRALFHRGTQALQTTKAESVALWLFLDAQSQIGSEVRYQTIPLASYSDTSPSITDVSSESAIADSSPFPRVAGQPTNGGSRTESDAVGYCYDKTATDAKSLPCSNPASDEFVDGTGAIQPVSGVRRNLFSGVDFLTDGTAILF